MRGKARARARERDPKGTTEQILKGFDKNYSQNTLAV